jgi:hypothetical protein
MGDATLDDFIYRPFCGKTCFNNEKVSLAVTETRHMEVKASHRMEEKDIILGDISIFLELGDCLSREHFDVHHSLSIGKDSFKPGLFHWRNGTNVYDHVKTMTWLHFLRRSDEKTGIEANCKVEVRDNKFALVTTKKINKYEFLVFNEEDESIVLSNPCKYGYNYTWAFFETTK